MYVTNSVKVRRAGISWVLASIKEKDQIGNTLSFFSLFWIQEKRCLLRHDTPYSNESRASLNTVETQQSCPRNSRWNLALTRMLMLAPAWPCQKLEHQRWPVSFPLTLNSNSKRDICSYWRFTKFLLLCIKNGGVASVFSLAVHVH